MENQSAKAMQWLSISIIVASVIISGTILITSNKDGQQVVNQPNNQQPNPNALVRASVGDSPVLGDNNAPVTMIEYSDYECPFCKRHFELVYPDIKRDYIDTGKVKLVFKDFIAVPSHNPLATSQAMAARCAREQGGDAMYYRYHDEIFKRTNSGGNGLAVSDLTTIARDLGINTTNFQTCLNSGKYREAVNKDGREASQVGITGTPSFVIGKSEANGNIEGKIVVGAVPYESFQAVIEEFLNK